MDKYNNVIFDYKMYKSNQSIEVHITKLPVYLEWCKAMAINLHNMLHITALSNLEVLKTNMSNTQNSCILICYGLF